MSGCKHYHKKEKPEIYFEKIRQNGLRLTEQRVLIIKSVMKFHQPFTVDELKTAIAKNTKSRDVDLVTFYRCLAKFHEIGILAEFDFGDGTKRYELAPSDGSHHHHVICKKCHKVEALEFCIIQGQEQVIKQMGYSDLSHRLEFFGLCRDCGNT